MHGDYDADGICATAVMVRSLERLGADVDSYIPDRTEGLRPVGRDRRKARRARDRADHHRGLCDHRRRGGRAGPRARPRGPRDRPPSSSRRRAAARCANSASDGLRLPVRGPLRRRRRAQVRAASGDARRDRAPRAPRRPRSGRDRRRSRTSSRCSRRTGRSCASACARSQRAPSPGCARCSPHCGIDPRTVGERDVAFRSLPGSTPPAGSTTPTPALELLMTTSAERAAAITAELDVRTASGGTSNAGSRRGGQASCAPLGERSGYVLAGTDWHPGVVGIVASRLAEASGCPVVLLCIDGADRTRLGPQRSRRRPARGARRLRRAARPARRPRRRRRARARRRRPAGLADGSTRPARRAQRGDTGARRAVDAIVDAGAIGLALAEELAAMGPFGEGNPPLCVLVRHALLADLRPMGEGRHLRFTSAARARACRPSPSASHGSPSTGPARRSDLHARGQRVARLEPGTAGAAPRAGRAGRNSGPGRVSWTLAADRSEP